MLNRNPYADYNEHPTEESDVDKAKRLRQEALDKKISKLEAIAAENRSSMPKINTNAKRKQRLYDSRFVITGGSHKIPKNFPQELEHLYRQRDNIKSKWIKLAPDDPKRIKYVTFQAFFQAFLDAQVKLHEEKKQKAQEEYDRQKAKRLENPLVQFEMTCHQAVSKHFFPQDTNLHSIDDLCDIVSRQWGFKTRVQRKHRREFLRLFHMFLTTGEEQHKNKAVMLPRDSARIRTPKAPRNKTIKAINKERRSRGQKPIGFDFTFTPNPVRDYRRESKDRSLFYQTKAWQQLRFRAFALYGNVCGCCGRKPPEVILHVDHIKPRSKYPLLELDITNLQILCEECNMGKSNLHETDFRSKVID